MLRAHPEWAALVSTLAASGVGEAAIRARLEALRGPRPYRNEDHLKCVLRQLRNQILLALMERDLAGRADLEEVMRAMTALAETAIAEALAFLSRELAQSFGVPRGGDSARAQDLLVVGMGKLGGAELNASSDIDLVFVYGEDGETGFDGGTGSDSGSAQSAQRTLSNHEFFTRLGRRLIGVLSELTGDGFVFRVDMRLRPNGDSGPLVASLAMLEDYFVAQGRNWERYAWIKARAVSPAVLGSHHAELEASLAAIVTPFVYRRYLDFGAIQALRALHEQIRAEVGRRNAEHAGRAENVKLGRGGIREIEFIAQHFQLIRGGRDALLRSRSTEATLELLAARGLLPVPIAEHLIRSYRLLRNIEHRLQYLDDAQTHSLPQGAEDRARLVSMCACLGVADFAGLRTLLAEEQGFVAAQFDLAFGLPAGPAAEFFGRGDLWSDRGPGEGSDPEQIAGLAALGFDDPEAAARRLRALWASPRIGTLSESNRARLDSLIPHALALAQAHGNTTCSASVLLGRLLDLLDAVATRAAYLALLSEFPRAFERVAVLLAASPWAARYLAQHPLLLDELLDTRTLRRPDWAAVATALEDAMQRARGDVERQMDLLRETHHAQTFSLLILDLEARLELEELSDDLSALADLILAAALKACREVVGAVPEAAHPFAIIAYGKLGGKELGYASDLDLVFVCADEEGEGGAGLRYARLAQRLMTWLTSRTTAGGLFDVDLRLRPDGAAGLLVATLLGFKNYQEHNAWVWEHQALTRARHCAGDPGLGAAFEAERRAILAAPRDLGNLRQEIAGMRAKMHAGHPNPSGLFDLKHDQGGMVDIEFCVQYLVLGFSRLHPELLENVGNIALLRRAGQAGLIEAGSADAVARAYREYRRRQHRLRLSEAGYARVPPAEFEAERAAVGALCQALGLALG